MQKLGQLYTDLGDTQESQSLTVRGWALARLICTLFHSILKSIDIS